MSPESHEEALARNALHRKQLAEVIEENNKRIFGELDTEVQEKQVKEVSIVRQVNDWY